MDGVEGWMVSNVRNVTVRWIDEIGLLKCEACPLKYIIRWA